MSFNPYNIYSINAGIKTEVRDQIDTCINEIKDFCEYDEIKNYLEENFGNIQGEKWIHYEELHKNLYLRVESDRIEVCALKNEQQYFGKGWKLLNKK